MKTDADPGSRLAESLRAVPAGTLETLRGNAPASFGLTLEASVTEGKGRMTVYSVLPGTEVAYTELLAPGIRFRHESKPGMLTFFYCRAGRLGWTMRGATSVYLGPGDMTVHSAECCSESCLQTPLGYLEGISVLIDLDRLEAALPGLLPDLGADPSALRSVLAGEAPLPVASDTSIDSIFAPLFALPPERKEAWLRHKVRELLLWLTDFRPAAEAFPHCPAYQTEIVRAVRDELTAHPERRPTIDELARRHFINTSALKAVFKSVYGLPIAAYMRAYRVRMAAALLRGTDATVAEIAARVGYGTQGKFAETFRGIYGMLPTEYRRAFRPSAGA